MNKKGFIHTFMICAWAVGSTLAGTLAYTTVKSASNGQIQKNNQSIWCNMQGKGRDVCDQLLK
jgi:hypothetical protein